MITNKSHEVPYIEVLKNEMPRIFTYFKIKYTNSEGSKEITSKDQLDQLIAWIVSANNINDAYIVASLLLHVLKSKVDQQKRESKDASIKDASMIFTAAYAALERAESQFFSKLHEFGLNYDIQYAQNSEELFYELHDDKHPHIRTVLWLITFLLITLNCASAATTIFVLIALYGYTNLFFQLFIVTMTSISVMLFYFQDLKNLLIRLILYPKLFFRKLPCTKLILIPIVLICILIAGNAIYLSLFFSTPIYLAVPGVICKILLHFSWLLKSVFTFNRKNFLSYFWNRTTPIKSIYKWVIAIIALGLLGMSQFGTLSIVIMTLSFASPISWLIISIIPLTFMVFLPNLCRIIEILIDFICNAVKALFGISDKAKKYFIQIWTCLTWSKIAYIILIAVALASLVFTSSLYAASTCLACIIASKNTILCLSAIPGYIDLETDRLEFEDKDKLTLTLYKSDFQAINSSPKVETAEHSSQHEM